MAEVVTAADAADVHTQMQGKLCSKLYAVKDTSLLPQQDFAICVVHVAPECQTSDSYTQAITQLASLYCGADDVPLYVLHIFPDQQKLDISFANTPLAHALVERIEQDGIAPVLRACGQAFTEQPQCNLAYLYYDSVADMERGTHTVVLGHNMKLPLPVDEHTHLYVLLRLSG